MKKEKNSIYSKLLNAQKRIASVKKKKENPFFHSSYADINSYIEEVKPILNECGLIILQPLTIRDGKMALKTVIIDSDSKEEIKSVVPLPEDTDPQKMGAVITYFRRYAIQSMLFLQAEDDDANSASANATGATRATEKVSTEKECPVCHKRHTGQYPTCIPCWSKNKKVVPTKTVVNEDVAPF